MISLDVPQAHNSRGLGPTARCYPLGSDTRRILQSKGPTWIGLDEYIHPIVAVVDASCVLDSEVEVAGVEDSGESGKAQYLAMVAVGPLPAEQAEYEEAMRDLPLCSLAAGMGHQRRMEGRSYFDQREHKVRGSDRLQRHRLPSFPVELMAFLVGVLA